MDRITVNKDHIPLLIDIVANYSRVTNQKVTVSFDQNFGTTNFKEKTGDNDNNVWIILHPDARDHQFKPVYWLEWLLFKAATLFSLPLRDELYDNVFLNKRHPINKFHSLLFPERYKTVTHG